MLARRQRLDQRLGRLEGSIRDLEDALVPGGARRGGPASVHPRWRRVRERQIALLGLIRALEERAGLPTTTSPRAEEARDDDDDRAGDATERRLGAELERRGMESTSYAFTDVQGNYYDKVLAVRASILGARGVEQLCKSIVLVNTHYDETSAAPGDSLWDSPYVVVIVQYITKLNSDAVAKVMHRMGTKGLARKRMNFQLCDDSDGSITGYAHNAVVPVGLRVSRRRPRFAQTAVLVCSTDVRSPRPSTADEDAHRRERVDRQARRLLDGRRRGEQEALGADGRLPPRLRARGVRRGDCDGIEREEPRGVQVT